MSNQDSPLKGFKPILNKEAMGKGDSNSNPVLAGPISPLSSIPPSEIARKCERCNTALMDNANFCPVCGTPISPITPVAGVPAEVLCSYCGVINPTDAKFCGNCGKMISKIATMGSNPVVKPTILDRSSLEHSMPVQSFHQSPQIAFPPPPDLPSATRPKIPAVPTIEKGAFSSYFKTGKLGLISIPVLIIAISVLVFGGLILTMAGVESNIDFLENVGYFMMALGFLSHAISGFVGLFRLFAKGWTLEVLGCMLIGGGSPILFPVMFGFLFYIFAEIFPKRR